MGLPSLEHKCPKSQLIAILAALQDFFLRKAVTAGIPVRTADPAVIAVISAVIGKFYQTSCIYFISKIFFLYTDSLFPKQTNRI